MSGQHSRATESRWSERTIACALLAIHGALLWLQRAPGMTTGQDDAAYMLLARSLRTGHYVDAFLVGNPPHAQYPPGYPAVLALLGSLFGERYQVFVAWNVVASVVALAVFYTLVRRRWAPWLAWSVLALMALSPETMSTASRVRSEPTFLLAFVLLLWSLEETRSNAVRTVGAPLLAAASFLVRTAGAPFVAGVAAYWGLQREWRRAVMACALMVLPVASWTVWSYRAQRQTIGDSYWTPLATVVESPTSTTSVPQRPNSLDSSPDRRVAPPPSRAPSRTPLVVTRIKDYLIEGIPTITAMPLIAKTRVDNVAWLVITGVGFLVGAVVLWREWQAATVLGGAYLGMLLLWVWHTPRLLEPVFPILVLALLLGWQAVSLRLFRRPPIIPLVIAGVLVVSSLLQLRTRLRDVRSCEWSLQQTSGSCYTPEQIALFAAAADLRARAAPNEHTVTAKPETFGYLTGLQFVPVPPVQASTARGVLAQFAAYEVKYAFLGHLRTYDANLARLLTAVCEHLDLVAAYQGDSYLFVVRRSAETAPSGQACAALNARQPDATYTAANIRW